MPRIRRRTFIKRNLALGAALVASGVFLTATQSPMPMFHHVFFWLKNPSSAADLQKLLDGLRTLPQIETVRSAHIGVPATTPDREVVDHSFHASLLLEFSDVDAHNTYQDHPIHQAFVKNCSALWTKVIVYDASDV